MDNSHRAEPTKSSDDLEAIASLVYTSVQTRRGDGEALLALLRSLEQLHRDICDGPFQEAMPKSRQGLYKLLRDIESKGGWPYIPRMRLQTLLATLSADFPEESAEPNPK
jgi:hypothetical protein